MFGILIIAIGAGLVGYSYIETGYRVTSYKDRSYLEPFSLIERVAPGAYRRYWVGNLTSSDTLEIEVHATHPVQVSVVSVSRNVNVSQWMGYDIIVTVIPPHNDQYYIQITNLNKDVSLTYSISWKLTKPYTRTVFPFSGLGVFLLILGIVLLGVLAGSRLRYGWKRKASDIT